MQDLLKRALIIEEKKVKAAQKLERRLQLTEMTHQQREKVWMEEMSEGILEESKEEGETARGGEKEEEEEEGMEDCALGKRPVRAEERKTKKQRRKEQLRRREVSRCFCQR